MCELGCLRVICVCVCVCRVCMCELGCLRVICVCVCVHVRGCDRERERERERESKRRTGVGGSVKGFKATEGEIEDNVELLLMQRNYGFCSPNDKFVSQQQGFCTFSTLHRQHLSAYIRHVNCHLIC